MDSDLPISELSPADLRQQEWAELRARPAAEFGPTMRDRTIARAIGAGRDVEAVAKEHGLRPRTVQAIARTTDRQLARRQDQLDQMSFDELCDEETRLRRLNDTLVAAWKASLEPRTITKRVETRRRESETTLTLPGRGQLRFQEIRVRVLSEMLVLEGYVNERSRMEELEAARRRRCAVRTVPARTRRRISLSGKRLRLPRHVRARSATRSATAFRAIFSARHALKTWVQHVGVPPPEASFAAAWRGCDENCVRAAQSRPPSPLGA